MSAAKKTGNFVVWGILLLLILGLGGFGIRNFGGGVQTIGSVGDTKITVDTYFRELSRELRAAEKQSGARVTMAQAQASGLVARARGRVISDAALDNDLAGMGLSVGDAQVRKQLLSYDAFKGADGKFDREAYKYTLEQNGLTESGFEAQIRGDTTRSLLQGAIVAGTVVPKIYMDTMLNYIGARRSYAMIRLGASDLDTPVGTPDDAQLKTYYDAHGADFTAPPSKSITYAWMTPDMIVASVQVDPANVKALYNERLSQFVKPEKRLVERLVFPSEAGAQQAKDRLDAGTASFADLVKERGLKLADVDLGAVDKPELGEAGNAVFAMDAPGVVGPVISNLGPALIRMNGVLAAKTTTFEQAAPALRKELTQAAARRQIGDRISNIDDLLAGGATLEDLASETDMQLGTIDYPTGQDQGIAGYDKFRTAADAAKQGDFPEITELKDGGIFALRVDSVTDAHLRPLDEVRDTAIAGWKVAETARLLTEKAEAMKVLLDAGDSIQTLGPKVETFDAVTRGAVAPPELAVPVFKLEPGGSTVVTGADGSVYLVRLKEALPPDTADKTVQLLKSTIQQQTGRSMAQDLFSYFTQARLAAEGLHLNEAAVKAVHARFP